MKTIVAGSRTITNYDFVWSSIAACPWHNDITEIVSGAAQGVDKMGESYARAHPNIKIKRFPAQWDAFGKRAGVMRNKDMAEYSDGLILIWDGQSKGSKNMLSEAKKRGLRIFNVTIQEIEEE